ncbi:MAG: hypothetical protein LC720_02945 [Actinobacteria bacterium]|nr:hypothetical protein [Actinomycetota bacterium]
MDIIEVPDDPDRDRDLLLGDRRQVKPGELLGVGLTLETAEARGLDGHPVVKHHGVDALQPLLALINQRLSQPDLRPQIKNVPRRDPRLGQPALHQQLAQPRVEAVVLRPTLAVLAIARRDRLRQAHLDAGAGAFLSHKTASRSSPRPLRRPPGARSGRGTPAWSRGSPGGSDLAGLHLPGRLVEPS